jgi:hypothetical protein
MAAACSTWNNRLQGLQIQSLHRIVAVTSMNKTVIESPMVAFKEWAAVCEDLLAGSQSLILRKGGIAEGRDGFAFGHRDFLLFPTFFHAQAEGLRRDVDPAMMVDADERNTLELKGFCCIEARAVLRDWSQVAALEPFHLWEEAVLRERFGYGDEQALHAAFVRVYALDTPVRLPFEKRFGGCRSWVSMPIENVLEGMAVLPQADHEKRYKDIDSTLGNNVLSVY